MKRLNIVAMAASVLLASSVANALDATVSWTPPTGFTDGTSIPVGTKITYRIYNQVRLVNTVVDKVSFFVAGIIAGENCFRVTAQTEGGEESDATSTVCKDVPAAVKKSTAPSGPAVK